MKGSWAGAGERPSTAARGQSGYGAPSRHRATPGCGGRVSDPGLAGASRATRLSSNSKERVTDRMCFPGSGCGREHLPVGFRSFRRSPGGHSVLFGRGARAVGGAQVRVALLGTFSPCDRPPGSLLEALRAPGESLAPWSMLRTPPGVLRLGELQRRPLNRARGSSPCALGTASAAKGDEPRGLRPDEPRDRSRARDEDRAAAPRLDAVPGSGNHGREDHGVPEPLSVPQTHRALARSTVASIRTCARRGSPTACSRPASRVSGTPLPGTPPGRRPARPSSHPCARAASPQSPRQPFRLALLPRRGEPLADNPFGPVGMDVHHEAAASLHRPPVRHSVWVRQSVGRPVTVVSMSTS